MDDRTDLDLISFANTLKREKDALIADSKAAADSRAPVALDQQSVGRLSRMDAIQVQAMANAVDARRQLRLKQIDGALARISAGDFGYCVVCDEEIPLKRLEIDPASPSCVSCADKKS